MRTGFIDMRGLELGSHHVSAIDENLDTSSLETEDDDDEGRRAEEDVENVLRCKCVGDNHRSR